MTTHSVMPGFAAAVASVFAAGSLAGQGAPDRSKPPELGPTPQLKLPPLQRFALSNGLRVVLLEKHQVPLVQVNVQLQVGAVLDPAGKSGLASITAAMLDEGAGPRNSLQLVGLCVDRPTVTCREALFQRTRLEWVLLLDSDCPLNIRDLSLCCGCR